VWGQIWKRGRTRFLTWIYITSREMGPGKTDSSIVELSSGSGTSTGLFLPTMSIFPPPSPGLLVSGGGLTVGLPNSPTKEMGRCCRHRGRKRGRSSPTSQHSRLK
jgi:hypothetical protein